MGSLFPLRRLRVRLAIALILLGGGLGISRSDGLGGFIRSTLLLIGHRYFFSTNKIQ
jgi:hypothetical protein